MNAERCRPELDDYQSGLQPSKVQIPSKYYYIYFARSSLGHSHGVALRDYVRRRDEETAGALPFRRRLHLPLGHRSRHGVGQRVSQALGLRESRRNHLGQNQPVAEDHQDRKNWLVFA